MTGLVRSRVGPSRSVSRSPRVSVGVPVYNGQKFIRHAIESILAQSYEDFEIIICDNASTDRTLEICRGYAARDSRIRLISNPENLGASRNYNRTFELATGDYFKWAAHDDVLYPEFLARAVAALDAAPDAVLCQALVEHIDASGRPFGLYDSRLSGAASARAAERFGTLILQSHTCSELYGLIRSDALRRTQLHASYHGGDRVLLAELALLGRFVKLQEPLQQIRDHKDRYTRSQMQPKERLAWHDVRQVGRRAIPTLRTYADYAAAIGRHVPLRSERLRCCLPLIRWWWCNWNGARVAVDLAALVAPGVVTTAERIKWRAFGVPPGHQRLDLKPEIGGEESERALNQR